MISKKKLYFENLDGLRFIAVLVVFLFHSFHTEFQYIKDDPIYRFAKSTLVSKGDLGVNFFFVLSGFLITYLLLAERAATGKVHLKAFYIRRALRIWPLYFFCVFFGFVVFPLLKILFDQIPNETANPIYFLTFLSNFNNIINGLPDASILGVLWSVSIEEQFYFFWPLLFIFFGNRYFSLIVFIIIVGSITFRLIYRDVNDYIYFHTFSVISDMCVGGLGAYFSFKFDSFKEYFKDLKKIYIGLIYVIGLILIAFRTEFFRENWKVLERIVYSLFFLLIILEQNYSKYSLFKIGRFKILTNLGKYTYAFYSLHFIGILCATTLGKIMGTNTNLCGVLLFETAIAFCITLFLSFLSYHYFEKYFLGLKERFAK